MPVRHFKEALSALEHVHEVFYIEADETSAYAPSSTSEHRVTEYLGSPRSLAAAVADAEVLLVHGAPVTAEVLAAGGQLRLVGCARGGPVNIDLEAIEAHGLPLVNTPGKNAEAVADLTLAFMVILARGLPQASRFVEAGNQLKDNWDGARFMGSDLDGHTLGLIGYGQVGQRVGRRARAFGMDVLVYDPFLRSDDAQQLKTVTELLARADFVSLHARATAANARMIDRHAIAAMRPGACLINTARASLVDEAALDHALAEGRLGGVALDVFEAPSPGERSRLLRHDNVILTPHIGGSTRETLRRGAEMLAEEIRLFAAAEPLRNLVGAVGAHG
jgi:D-3-phosphoglycerate dehydrogenase